MTSRNIYDAIGISHTTMKGEDGRHSSGQTIECATCGCRETVVTNTFAHRMPPEVLQKKFERLGWALEHRQWQCPNHKSKQTGRREKAVPIPPPAPTLIVRPAALPAPKERPMSDDHKVVKLSDLGEATIAKMGQSDHRRIFREIDNHWDEGRGRYERDWGDGKIATQLSVPRAWVEYIRKDSFGESGGSEEIDELSVALAEAEVRMKGYADQALKIAEKMDTLAHEVAGYRKQLDRIKVATGQR